MSDIICTNCRGKYTAGCEICNPPITITEMLKDMPYMLKSDDRIAELEAKLAELETKSQRWQVSYRLQKKENYDLMTLAIPELQLDLKDAQTRVAELQATIEGLASNLSDAIEDIGCWAGYASEYFQYKYDLAGMIKAYQDVLAALKPKENRDE